MNLIFNANITKKNIVVLNSSRQGKLSYHLIINNKIYFENMENKVNLCNGLKRSF